MQLPPTVLSLNNRRKKKGPVAAKVPGKKAAAAKTKSGPSEKPAAPGPPLVQVPQDDDHEVGSSDESDEGSDTMMKDDDDSVLLLDETKPEMSAPGGANPRVVKALRRRALDPPRTLETTLFDRLEKMYGPGIKRLLNVQYRCGGYFLELLAR